MAFLSGATMMKKLFTLPLRRSFGFFLRIPFLSVDLILFLLFVEHAFAESTINQIKTQVLENCVEAEKDIYTLTSHEREELLSYLVLVLKLQANELKGPGVPLPKIGSGGPLPLDTHAVSSSGGELLRSLEPNRESQARRCALTLLRRLTPESFRVLPELIHIQSEGDIASSDLQFSQLLDASIDAITRDISIRGDYEISAENYQKLIDLLTGPSAPVTGYRAEQVLLELSDRFFPRFIGSIQEGSPELRQNLFRILALLDPKGEKMHDFFVQELRGEDTDLQHRILSFFSQTPVFQDDILSSILPLIESSSRLREQSAKVFLALVRRRREQSGVSVLEPSLTERVIPLLLSDNEVVHDQMAETFKILVVDQPSLSTVLLRRPIGTLDEASLMRLLRIRDELGSLNADELGLVSQVRSRPSFALQDLSWSILGHQKHLQEKVLSVISETAKKNIGNKNKEAKEQEAYFALRTLRDLALKVPTASALIPVLRTGFAMERFPGVSDEDLDRTLAASASLLGPQVRNLLLSFARGKSEPMKRRAILALKAFSESSREISQLFLTLLESDERVLQAYAEEALIEMGAPLFKDVQKIYEKKAGEVRSAAARILFEVSSRPLPAKASKKYSILTTGELEKAGVFNAIFESEAETWCADRGQIGRKILDAIPSLQDELQRTLLRCLGEKDGEKVRQSVQRFLSFGTLSKEAAQSLLQLISDRRLNDEVSLVFLQNYNLLSLPFDRVRDLTIERLRSEQKNDSHVISLIDLLGEMGTPAAQAIPTLLVFAKAKENSPLIRGHAIAALVRIDPTSIDYEDIIRKSLSSNDSELAENVLKNLSSEEALAIVLRWFSGVDTEKRLMGLGILAEIPGEEALESVRKYLDDSDPRIRYHAAVGVIHRSPASLESKLVLKRELGGAFRASLCGERFSKDILPVVDQILAESPSLVESLYAESLKRPECRTKED